MDRRFKEKVAVITGAAGGIGRAAVERFTAEGAKVVPVDLPDSALDESVAVVERAGSEAHAVTAEVTSAADVERYVEEAKARFGGVDCFFNNAVIEGVVSPLTDYPEEVFDRVIAVNLKGVWLGMKYVGPAMRERGGGAIVNTPRWPASEACPVPSPTAPASTRWWGWRSRRRWSSRTTVSASTPSARPRSRRA